MPNDAQKAKIAQKELLKTQIDDIGEYLAVYQQERKEDANKEREKV